MPDAPVITSIEPSQRDPRRLSVRVDRRPAVTLAGKLAEELGLSVGVVWTPELAAKAKDAAAFEEAYHALAKRVNRRALSVREATDFLAGRGLAEPIVDRAIEHAVRVGLLSDDALARGLIDSVTRRRPAGDALLQHKLMSRGIGEADAERIIAGHRVSQPGAHGTGGEEAAAMSARGFAAAEFEKLSSLPPDKARRKVATLLARRGFDEDAIADAMEGLGER